MAEAGRIGQGGIWLAVALLTALAIACTAGLGVDLFRLTLRVPFNPDEGWNALRAADAMSQPNMYLPNGFANFPNYPPLSFYLIGWFGRLVGDNIIAGRIVAFASLLLVAAATSRYALAMGASRLGALAGGLLLPAYMIVHFGDYVGMNDPQWLGHALQAGGLLLVLRWTSGRAGIWTAIAAALLIVAGLFIKHNLLPLPGAVTIWLLLTDRRRLVTWLTAAGAFALAGAALCYGLFGWSIVQQVALHRRVYLAQYIVRGLNDLWPLLPYSAAALALALAFRANRVVWLFAIYVGLALIEGVLTRAGRGMWYNALFDLLIVSAAFGGLFVSGLEQWWRERPRLRWLGAAPGILLLLAPLLPYVAATYGNAVVLLRTGRAVERSFKPVYQTIAATEGAVACEDSALCYWGHKPNSIDFSNTAQLIRLDPAIAATVTARIRQHDFALVVLWKKTTSRFLRQQNAALVESYERERKKPVDFYRPLS